MRGEYKTCHLMNGKQWGSPPLARGVLSKQNLELFNRGITPACAGSTGQVLTDEVMNTDHPRLRGEYKRSGKDKIMKVGSPPLARGVLPCRLRFRSRKGITPACAGSTLIPIGCVLFIGDHPRLRGEYYFFDCIMWLFLGSPPLARGVL